MAIANQLNTATTPINIPEGGTGQTTNTAAINALVSAASLTSATVATGDLVLIQDISDSNNLKSVTAQSIANLATSGVTSVSGTANRITSTGGATPVIDISASYVGQSSITTLGTISSGTWGSSATLIAPASGGTGVANTGTITVGGNTAFSGAFTFTGTITGNTGVTFPTSGTLQTTAGASGIVSSGTANQIGYYASSGTTISGLTGANGSVLVTNNTGVPSMLANPAATGRVFQSANAAIPVWSTSSYADTYSVSTLLYASSANTVTGLATTNRASLSTNATGVPTWLALTDGQIVVGSSAGSPAAASLTAGTGITITPASNGITIAATGSGSGTVNSGTANQLAYYASNGTAVSGLTSANNSILVTSGAGVPSISGTLPFTLPVTTGGTGVATMTTAYAPVIAGTTATGALQVASTGLATSGFALVSNGSSAVPSFQAVGTVSGSAKFWIIANGAGTSILASFNVTSITDGGTGVLTVTIATDFSSANWVAGLSTLKNSTTSSSLIHLTSQAAGSMVSYAYIAGGVVATDPGLYYITGFGDQ